MQGPAGRPEQPGQLRKTHTPSLLSNASKSSMNLRVREGLSLDADDVFRV